MQNELFHEDLNSALTHVISAIGGNKMVGSDLWPSLSADMAGKKLANCLNDQHPQQLHPEELLWILAEARKAGVHSAMSYINRESGYGDPQPVEPEDEAAALMREFIQCSKLIQEVSKRLERLNVPVRVVA